VVYRRDGWVCGICREPVDPELESPHLMAASLDHVIPLCRGGTHTYDNVQLAHFLCNSIKGATEDTDPRDRDLVTGQFVVAAMAAGG
jgi:5-methylcytosine-specific restriction endonuclease McrA